MKNEIKEIADQLLPQIGKPSKEQTFKLRMEIAKAAQYYDNRPNHPYEVRWDCQDFISNDTCDLVNQVIAWLKQSRNQRAESIHSRLR